MVKEGLFIYLFIHLLTLFNVEKDIMVIYLNNCLGHILITKLL